MAMDINLSVLANYDDNAATTAATAACYFPKPDPLALDLCACTCWLATWVDPMLEELTTSLIVHPLAGAP